MGPGARIPPGWRLNTVPRTTKFVIFLGLQELTGWCRTKGLQLDLLTEKKAIWKIGFRVPNHSKCTSQCSTTGKQLACLLE